MIFPRDYQPARNAFRAAATETGFTLEEFPIAATGPHGELLTIDAATRGPENAEKTIVVTSGLHGVEAPLGSAIQVAWMRELAKESNPCQLRWVLIHSLNPFGFAWHRRANENNVDLNRNFHESFDTANPSTHLESLYRVLHPSRRPARVGVLFRLGGLALRRGVASVRQMLAQGQLSYPDWLFYGGDEPSELFPILRRNLPRWIGSAREIVHWDVHSGLGRWGQELMLLGESLETPAAKWWTRHFGTAAIAVDDDRNAYAVKGGFGPWCQHLFADRVYRFVTYEFGTLARFRVLKALVNEMRDWPYRRTRGGAETWASRAMRETFCPRSRTWQETVVRQGTLRLRQTRSVLEQSVTAQAS